MTNELTCDGHSFILNGKRIWLQSGELHYYRYPHQDWHQVLLRAKRAGLNTISTYVAWNFHELEEGEFRFDGARDLGHFLDLAQELGLYVAIRPGPYICAEWENGGPPSWLYLKPGIDFIHGNAGLLPYVRPWYTRLAEVLAPRQVTRGGPILWLQIDNEFGCITEAANRSWLRDLMALWSELGITIPFTGCNAHPSTQRGKVKLYHSEKPADWVFWPDLMLTYNAGLEFEEIRHLREVQPTWPPVVTEQWAGGQVYWNRPLSPWPPPDDHARGLVGYAAVGAQTNIYLVEGGTNFGFWGGGHIATGFSAAYPIGEGGVLREKFYRLRPMTLFNLHFCDFMAASDETTGTLAVTAPTGIDVLTRSAGAGHILFCLANAPVRRATLGLPGGIGLSVEFGRTQSAILPFGLQVLPELTLDYANVSLLARNLDRRLVALYGQAGVTAVFSANGSRHEATILRDRPQVIRLPNATIVVVDEQLAERAWFVDGHVVFGAEFIGERSPDGTYPLRLTAASSAPVEVMPDAALRTLPAAPIPPRPALPPLSDWQSASCVEAAGAGDGWQGGDAPLSHEQIGAWLGYVWYRAEFESPADGVFPLFLSRCCSRQEVFVNGRHAGTYGKAFDETGRWLQLEPHPFCVPLRKGKNSIAFLSDNLGRHWIMWSEMQGIVGPVYIGGRRHEIDDVAMIPETPVEPEVSAILRGADHGEAWKLPAVRFSVRVPQGERAYLRINLSRNLFAVRVDGRGLDIMGPFSQGWHSNSVELPEDCAGRECLVEIQHVDPNPRTLLQAVQLWTAPINGRLSHWGWKPMVGDVGFATTTTPQPEADPRRNPTGDEGPVLLLPDSWKSAPAESSGVPTFFRTRFPRPAGEQPVFLDIGAMFKGQIYLNGRNAGRFWGTGGTQTQYYLPRAWMADDNELVLFEERGRHPTNVALTYAGNPPCIELAMTLGTAAT